MPTLKDVRRIALALPETTEATSHGNIAWKVRDKGFVWERPLRRADLDALGDAAPDGVVIAARTADAGMKQALIVEAWLAQAPKRLATEYLASTGRRGR